MPARPQMKHYSLYMTGCDVEADVIGTLLSDSMEHPASAEQLGLCLGWKGL